MYVDTKENILSLDSAIKDAVNIGIQSPPHNEPAMMALANTKAILAITGPVTFNVMHMHRSDRRINISADKLLTLWVSSCLSFGVAVVVINVVVWTLLCNKSLEAQDTALREPIVASTYTTKKRTLTVGGRAKRMASTASVSFSA
jgi:hypothetical protein